MSVFFFSVSAHSVVFYDAQKTLLCELKGGYAQASAGLFSAGQADAYGLEMLIYRIEEILESQGELLPSGAEAIGQDALLSEVCDEYLGGSQEITTQSLENAFNQLTDRLSYAPLALPAEKIPLFCYFVFLREMTHHLRISRILTAP